MMPGFARLSFWLEQRVDEDEYGAWWNSDRRKPKYSEKNVA